MKIEIWSDIVCPWCYLGKRRLDIALADFAHRDEVEVHFRSFQLNPNSAEHGEPVAEMLARKYGSPPEQVRQQNARLVEMANAEGLPYKMDNLREANSFAAHRLLHAANETGGLALQAAVKERLFKAYFCDEAAVGKPDVLRALAVEAGMDQALVDEVLASDRYADQVRADQARAQESGISGVPFFLFEGKWGVSGAQSSETFRAALQEVWEKSKGTLGQG